MRIQQKLINNPGNFYRTIYGIIAIIIISCSIIAYNTPPTVFSPEQEVKSQPRLMKQASLEQKQVSSQIPNNLLNLLSEEDRKKLEEYEQYYTDFSGFDLEALEAYEQKLEQMKDPEQHSKNAYDYFTNHWVPEETTYNISSNELPNFEESLKSVFFEDWVKKPSYSLLDESGGETQSITSQDDQKIETIKNTTVDGYELIEKTIITPNQEITQRSVISEDYNITEVTEVVGKPRITIMEPDFSGFNRFQVPILSQAEVSAGGGGSSAEDVEWLNHTLDIKIGYEWDLPDFNYYLSLSAVIVRFRAWAFFEAGFHFIFPVRLIIEYPAEVIEGGQYHLKVTLIPLDIPDYNEFEIKFLLDVGAALDRIALGFYWGSTTVRVWLLFTTITVTVPVPIFYWYWKQEYNWPLVYWYFERNESYATPLAGDHIQINLGVDLDILPILAQLEIPYLSAICDVLSEFMELGVGLGFLKFVGESVTGLLEVSAGGTLASKLEVGWNNPRDSEALEFRVPQSEENYLDLSVSEVVFHASNVIWSPEFFIRFKDVAGLPLSEWLKEIRVPILAIDLGSMHLAALYDEYIVSTSTIAPSEVYDFSMDVTEISPDQGQGTFVDVSTYSQMYQIALRNVADRTDTIELGVQDLPEGYTASFERVRPQISSTPTTVILIVNPPEHIKAPPGEWPFNITATSLGKRNIGLGNDTVSKNVTLTVPDLVGMSLHLDLDYHPSEVIQVSPDMTLPIKFYGGNLGNVDDNITVTASIYSVETTFKTWESNHSVNPYGSGAGQYYSGEFGFTYNKSDLFPTPGLYTLDVQATSQRSPTFIIIQRRVLNFTTYYDLETSIDPEVTTMFANFETNFTYTLKNTGNARANFTLTSSGWDEYLSFPSKILNLEPNETEEVIITLKVDDPDNLPPALYNFRITANPDGSKETVFSADVVEVNVLAPDYVAPAITHFVQYLSPSGHVFPESTLTLGLVWEAFDEYPNSYNVYINDTIEFTGTWENDTPVFVPVTGAYQLPPGLYNITITFDDNSGNVATDQVWVTINPTDTIQPSIVPVINQLTIPQNFSYPHYLTWNCTEEYLFNATIYRNGTKISTSDLFVEQEIDETSTFRAKYILRPGSLPIGAWNYTLFVQDMNNNTASSTIIVIVTSADSDLPQITDPPDISAYLKHGNILSFNATDDYPDRFELWIDGKLEYNMTWESDEPVIFNVDDLNLTVGPNNLEIYLYDLTGQYTYYQWTFTLYDSDSPTFLVEPSDFTVYEHELSDNIHYWQVHDFDPNSGTYQIYRESELIKEDSWTPAYGIVSVPLANLTPGLYYYEAIFGDNTGNHNFSRFYVTVEDVLDPYIWPRDPIRFEPFYTASWFEFFITELHLDSYSLFRNDVLVDQGSISEEFPFLLVDMSDLPSGQYIYKLRVLDESGNLGEESVQVTVTDYTPPFIKKAPDLVYSEGTTGHTITWEIFEANPRDFSLYLNDQLVDSGTLTETNLTISVDALALGVHEYLLVVYDDKEFSHSSSCFVVVVDITAPTLSHISDCRFVLGDPDAKLVWEAYDLHLAFYTIKLNGTVIRSQESWTGNDITLAFVGWTLGTQNIELIVSDTSGNIATDEVVVKLIEEEEKSGKAPTPAPGFVIFCVLTVMVLIPVIRRIKRK